MAEMTVVVNGQEISGMFPVETFDPDQYGVYKCADFTINVGSRSVVPIGERASGLLPEFTNNHITLNAGIYIIRFPRYNAVPFGQASTLNFYGITSDDISIMGQRYDIVNATTTTIPPLFIVVLDKTETIYFAVQAYVNPVELTVENGIMTDFVIVKLDQPRISSLAGNAGKVDTVNFLEPDAATKNVQITHVYDTEEHWFNGYTRIDNNGNEHYEPPKSEVLKRDGAEIIKLWE